MTDIYKRVWYSFFGIPIFYKIEFVDSVPESKLKDKIKKLKENKKVVI